MAVCQTAPNLFGGCVFEGIPKWRGGGDKLWDVVNSLWNLKIKLGSVRDHWAHIGP